MDNEKRELKQIKEDLKIITSNKLNMSQSKLLFMGIIYEIILRKDLFPKNEDLKGFINNIFIQYFIDKEPFKDYLYDTRTLLGARIQKKIQTDLDYNKIVEIVNKIYNILPNEDINNNRKKNYSNNNKELIEWMNFIKQRGSKE
ncbi:hypothetical protein Q3V94_09325 [Caloramator sp. CAR-1]|uniref:hypothetical protein n=1 Tax=Caloramator sp. CAR-1 TaxID=3062777 RepID=UPI0026E3DE66|nr:hypothetical protein [Caloramator sp. CAR-1]MDO6355259.1 hypothetical protein [Caloramator sp. CAR-1]